MNYLTAKHHNPIAPSSIANPLSPVTILSEAENQDLNSNRLN